MLSASSGPTDTTQVSIPSTCSGMTFASVTSIGANGNAGTPTRAERARGGARERGNASRLLSRGGMRRVNLGCLSLRGAVAAQATLFCHCEARSAEAISGPGARSLLCARDDRLKRRLPRAYGARNDGTVSERYPRRLFQWQP